MTELMKVSGTINPKSTITSLEIVEQINLFRNLERNRTGLQHNDLLKIIRDEFEDEIGVGQISQSSYVNSQNKRQPMYELTLSQAKQILVRESKYVRKAVIAWIDELERYINESVKKPQFEIPQTYSQALMLAAQQAEVIEKQQLQLTEQAPKVEFAESVKASIDDISIDELAKLIAQNGIQIGEKRLFKWMRDNNYLTKDNLPYQRWVERGYLKLDQKIRFNHEQKLVAYTQTRVTATGQIYFMNKFLNYNNNN